ncbi:MAG: DUF3368 domain-containing protein [Flammeovirgaceae bacterium]|jgi:predicted nucleic acid-binding protein|nr:DUF3368 domain-containing protein [Flammeovirgaceae bacterium]
MHKIVISDTSCLIILEKIDKIFLLKEIYSEVITTPEIQIEYGKELPEWIKILSAKNKSFQKELETKIDVGESSAIALGLETPDCTIILDDLKARKIAESLHVNFTGTLGILVKAKQLSLIPSVKPIIKSMQEVGLRFSAEVAEDIIKQAGE